MCRVSATALLSAIRKSSPLAPCSSALGVGGTASPAESPASSLPLGVRGSSSLRGAPPAAQCEQFSHQPPLKLECADAHAGQTQRAHANVHGVLLAGALRGAEPGSNQVCEHERGGEREEHCRVRGEGGGEGGSDQGSGAGSRSGRRIIRWHCLTRDSVFRLSLDVTQGIEYAAAEICAIGDDQAFSAVKVQSCQKRGGARCPCSMG